MASMTELFYGDKDPAWSFSTFYDFNDHNDRHEVDPQFSQDYITRYMKPPIEIKCCSKCEDRLRTALRNIPGVDSVVSTHNNKKLIVTGSADNNTIHYALKHIQKRHHHFLPQKLHNPFRLLLPRHSHSRYAPSWDQATHAGPYSDNARHAHNYNKSHAHNYNTSHAHNYNTSHAHNYNTSHAHNYNTSYADNYENDDNWKHGSKYGLGYGQAPQHHYKPGSLRQILFDSHRSSRHSHSGYTYY